MIKKIVIVALFFPFIAMAQQSPYASVTIASPTAASLAKYADIPVNYHTGVPNVSIPIYEIKDGNLSLPISLSYYAGGLKVMEPASWVGAGWSLSAGGVISRTVRGAPDERFTSTTYDQSKGYFSDYGYHSYETGACTVPNPDVNNNGYFCGKDFFEGRKDGEPDLFFFNMAGYTGKFYFNDDRTPVLIPGQDLKIEYTYNETGVGASIQNFTLTVPNGTKFLFGRTPSTADVDPVEITDPYSGQAGFIAGNTISSWYLNKIISDDGTNSIVFTYEAEDYGLFNISTYPVAMGDPGDQQGINCSKNIVHGVRLKKISYSNGSVDFNEGAMRLDLSTADQSMSSDAGTHTAKSLAEIQINPISGNCKKFSFSYDYFSDLTTTLSPKIAYAITTDQKRLKLAQVQESDCATTTPLPPYVFSYFAEQVPRRLSCAQDHWGFNNGVSTNQGLIPTYSINKYYFTARANRDAVWPAMRGGSMNKISYPTGGSVIFDFEPHKTWISYIRYDENYITYVSAGYGGLSNTVYTNISFTGTVHKIRLSNSSVGGNAYVNTPGGTVTALPGQTVEQVLTFAAGTYSIGVEKNNASSGNGCEAKFYDMPEVPVNENAIVGGLRIKNITYKDGITNNDKVTNFSYVDQFAKSTGILYARPTYLQYVRNNLLGEVGLGGVYPNNVETPAGYTTSPPSYNVSGSSVRALGSTQGGHIGYAEVKVSETGNGFSIYRYYGSNYWDNIIGDVAIRNLNPADVNNTSVPNYPEEELPHEYTRGDLKFEGHFKENGSLIRSVDYYSTYVENKMVTPCVRTAAFSNTWATTFFDLKTSRKTEQKTIEHVKVDNGLVSETINTTFFESPYHFQPTRTSSLDSRGLVTEQKMKYAYDFALSCDVASGAHQNYLTNAATFYSQYQSSLYGDNSSWSRRYKNHLYQQNMHNLRLSYIGQLQTERTNFTTCFNTAFNNQANIDLRAVLLLRKKSMNPSIESTSWKNSKLLGATYTQYGFMKDPTGAYITDNSYPLTLAKLQLAAPSTTFTNASVSGTNASLTKDSRYIDETTLNIQNGNPVEIKPAFNPTASYIWAYLNKLPIAKVINADQNGCAHSSFETDEQGNFKYENTSIVADATAPTGKKAYSLTPIGAIKKSNVGLVAGKKYVVSYWSKNGAYSFTLATVQNTTTGKTINGWTFYTHEVTVQGNMALTGTGLIDEVRFYPADGQMETYTYDPVLGMTTKCDINNIIAYYEYDVMGRLKAIRDQDKNMIKTFDYKYQQPQ